jgi:hypothetical protein
MTLLDYIALIPPFNAGKPRFVNMLAALIQPMVDAQALLAALTADFDLDGAVGVQLDIVGQWIGRTRYLQVPKAGVYFSFDDSDDGTANSSPRTGFDQGVWLGKFDPTTALIAMPDDTYRKILKLQAIANEWDGTLPSIQAAFNAVYPGVVVQDNGDVSGKLMSMDVLIPGIEMNSLELAALQQDFPIKPSGVRVNIIESSVTTTPLFGFDIDNSIIGGMDHGSWGIVIQST